MKEITRPPAVPQMAVCVENPGEVSTGSTATPVLRGATSRPVSPSHADSIPTAPPAHGIVDSPFPVASHDGRRGINTARRVRSDNYPDRFAAHLADRRASFHLLDDATLRKGLSPVLLRAKQRAGGKPAFAPVAKSAQGPAVHQTRGARSASTWPVQVRVLPGPLRNYLKVQHSHKSTVTFESVGSRHGPVV